VEANRCIKQMQLSGGQIAGVGSEKSGIPHSGNSGTPSDSQKS